MEFERPVVSQFRKLYLMSVIHNVFNPNWSLNLLAEKPEGKLLLLLLLLTEIEFSLGGSSPYTSTYITNKNKYT